MAAFIVAFRDGIGYVRFACDLRSCKLVIWPGMNLPASWRALGRLAGWALLILAGWFFPPSGAQGGCGDNAITISHAEFWLYTFVYVQGVASLRLGENDNRVLCRLNGDRSRPILKLNEKSS